MTVSWTSSALFPWSCRSSLSFPWPGGLWGSLKVTWHFYFHSGDVNRACVALTHSTTNPPLCTRDSPYVGKFIGTDSRIVDMIVIFFPLFSVLRSRCTSRGSERGRLLAVWDCRCIGVQLCFVGFNDSNWRTWAVRLIRPALSLSSPKVSVFSTYFHTRSQTYVTEASKQKPPGLFGKKKEKKGRVWF